MSLRLKIKKKFTQRSGRVKSVDLHPTEPWILASLFTGTVAIWNYQNQTLVTSFEVPAPVRSAKFIARKQWVVAGADDKFIRVYNYNIMDKVKDFKAHEGRIRCVAVHPTLPYVLTSSDDMFIKLWDWDQSWTCTQKFEGHSDYVMQVTFNPKDTNTFASASLDCKIKIWNLGSPDPNFTLDAHLEGVTCVDYISGGDKPYLITGSDDHTAKVWDYQTESSVQTLEGHTDYVSAVCFHPELPIIMTGSEDGTVRIWHASTYRLENFINCDLGRVWAIGYMKGLRRVVIGYDKGTIMVKIGRKEPIVASMDNSGVIIWAERPEHNETQTVNIKSAVADYEVDGERLTQTVNIKSAVADYEVDGERLLLEVKEIWTCDIYPQSLKHNPNGGLVVICGDGWYTIYTAVGGRKKSSGSALEFVWSTDGEYAVRESASKIKFFSKNFQEKKDIRPTYSAKRIYGGILLAMCSNDFICFYDWAECRLIWRTKLTVKNLYWADCGDLVAIASDTSFRILKYNGDVVSQHLDSGRAVDEHGVEGAFELLYEINERVRTGLWVGEFFIYNNSSWQLNYCVGGEVTTIFQMDRPMYLLGYLGNQSRVYLFDEEFNVVGYTFFLKSLIEYKTLVMRGDVERASEILLSIPEEHRNRLFPRRITSLQYQKPTIQKPSLFLASEVKMPGEEYLTICGLGEGPLYIGRAWSTQYSKIYLNTPSTGGTLAKWLAHHGEDIFCKLHELLGELRPKEELRRVIVGMMRAVCELHLNDEYHGGLRDARNYFISMDTDYRGRGCIDFVEVTILNRKGVHGKERKERLLALKMKDLEDIRDLIFIEMLKFFDADGIEKVVEEIIGERAKEIANLKVPDDLLRLRNDFLGINEKVLYNHPAVRHHVQRFDYYSDIHSEIYDLPEKRRRAVNIALGTMTFIPQWKKKVVDPRLKNVLTYRKTSYDDNDAASLLRFLKAACLHLNKKYSLSEAEIDKLLRDTFPTFLVESYRVLSEEMIYC